MKVVENVDSSPKHAIKTIWDSVKFYIKHQVACWHNVMYKLLLLVVQKVVNSSDSQQNKKFVWKIISL